MPSVRRLRFCYVTRKPLLVVIAACLLSVIHSPECRAQKPKAEIIDETIAGLAEELSAPKRIEASGVPIDVDGFASPTFADLNDDGKQDLLIGQLDHGRTRVYLNVGTNESPRYEDFSWLRAADEIASIPSGCAVGFTPQVIDFDGNGTNDILTGSFYGGVCFLFRGKRDGSFEAAEPIENERGFVQLPTSNDRIQYNSTVHACDWDDDGDLDLILGRSRLHLIENTGTTASPVFADGVRLKLGDEEFPASRIVPVVADWNGDGRNDLITGIDGHVVWFRGVGMKGLPDFEPPRILVHADAFENEIAEFDADRTAPCKHVYAVDVSDFNSDGELDLIIGDHYIMRRELDDEDEARYEEATLLKTEFWRDYQGILRAQPDSMTPDERKERYRELLARWGKITEDWVGIQSSQAHYERHGGVWVYLRKKVD